jgi:adenine-specific DNA-methyltransferase
MTEEYIHQPMFTYLGNKRKLLDFIEEQVKHVKKKLKKDKLVMMDGFSGSGVVARMLSTHASELHTNDLEFYADTSANCYVKQPTKPQQEKIAKHIEKMNELAEKGPYVEGIMTKYYAPKSTENPKEGEVCFYTRENAKIIDTLRNYIEKKVENDLTDWCLGPLIVQCSIICNSMGHTQAFFKDKNNVGTFHKTESHWNRVKEPIKLECPIWSPEPCKVTCHNQSTNDLIKKLKGPFDLIYYDPPYNQHEYSHMYFLLNVIITNKKAKAWTEVTHMPDRSERNLSDFNKEESALKAMTDLIEDSLKISKYVLISYNDEGIISSDKWKKMLEPYEYNKIKKEYKRFTGRNGEAGNVYEIMYLIKSAP